MRAGVYFIVLLVSFSLVVDDVDAAWKFWKKKDKDKDQDQSTTESSSSSTTVSPSSTTASNNKAAPTPTPGRQPVPTQKKGETQKGIAAAADPALAIGVGNVGDRIREDARGQPRKPSPGTEVGLDIGPPRPVRPGTGGGQPGQGYRDWAADLTGSGGNSGRQSPKLPDVGPALVPGGRPGQGNRPDSVPGTSSGQQPAVVPGSRPASVPGTPSGQQPSVVPGNKPATPPGTPTGQQIPTSAGAGNKPAGATPSTTAAPIPAARPSTTPTSPQKPVVGQPQPASPTGTRSWAEVAGGGSKPGSPTPAPKSQSPLPSRPGQRPFDYPQPASTSRPGLSPGSAIAAGGAAVAAGGIAAGAAANAGGQRYSSSPVYSKGKTVTDEDLDKLSEALFIKDNNNANKYITLNLQKTTSGSSTKDEAPQPLLQVKPEALQIPTIQRVISIYDNYKLDTRENEYISPSQRQEESLLIDTFLSTNVMATAMRFLADKGFIKKEYFEYKDTLRSMWFNLYSRGDGKIGSTGFEHVFLTELKLGTEVSGLHNWIYFNAEETKNRLDYLGYTKKVDLGNKAAIAKVHVKFNGIDKPVTTVFIGTSPELEMALYTVCFFARPDALCPVSLGGTKFNIQTYKFRYRGRDLMGSAYPEI